MRVDVEERVPRETILDVATSTPGATFFHSPAWSEALDLAVPRFRPRWLVAREGTRILAYLPFVEIPHGPFFTLQAMPFGTYGDPVGDRNAAGVLLDRFFRIAATPRCLEAVLTGVVREGAGEPPAGIDERSGECSVIDLGANAGDYRAKLSKKKRQLHNRAVREGIVARPLETMEEVSLFHRIYAGCSRAWGGVHPYPERLFLELFRRREDGVVFWGGFLAGRLLGGHVDFYFGETAQAWQAGQLPEAHEHDVATVLIVSAVEEARRRGARSFNLGSSLGDEGLRFFKRSLGGRDRRCTTLVRRKRWWKLIRSGEAAVRESR